MRRFGDGFAKGTPSSSSSMTVLLRWCESRREACADASAVVAARSGIVVSLTVDAFAEDFLE